MHLNHILWQHDSACHVAPMEHMMNINERQLPDTVLLTIEDTRNLLGGIARSTVYLLLDKGQLQSVRIASRRLVTVSSIHQLLVSHAIPQKSAGE